MSKVGLWLALAVALAMATAMYIASSDRTAIGTILILGITALVVVWYADATGQMAASTRALAESSARPELVVRCPDHPMPARPTSDDPFYAITGIVDSKYWWSMIRSRVINEGTGPAFSVSLEIDDGSSLIAGVLPRGGIAYHPKLSEIAKTAASKQTVALRYKDGSNKGYHSEWVYDEEIRNWRAKEENDDTSDDAAE